MKKTVMFIFSFYLLALAVFPCGDKDDCHIERTEISYSNILHHSEHDTDATNCSPFCICACCGQTFNGLMTCFSIPVHFPGSTEKYQIDNSSFISEVYQSIWQPPKIS